VRWDSIVAWEGEAPIETIRAARLRPNETEPSVVATDFGGDVVLLRFHGGVPRAERIYRHGAALTGIGIVDLDSAVPGAEIYVGGAANGRGGDSGGGAVVRLTPAAGGYRAETIYRGGAYVHALEPALDATGRPCGIYLADHDGALRRLRPSSTGGEWTAETLYREPAEIGGEDRHAKDLCTLTASDDRPAEIVMALRSGRCVAVDPTRVDAGRLLFTEPGGVSRLLARPDGSFLATGYAGRVLSAVRRGLRTETTVWHVESPEGGLRGVVAGRFPTPAGEASFAVFGALRTVRLLRPSFETYDATTIFRDVERGHAIAAADLYAGDDADELIVGGRSRRITVLRVAPGS
jgi:hypothetical protein